jgi:hypothetical protein
VLCLIPTTRERLPVIDLQHLSQLEAGWRWVSLPGSDGLLVHCHSSLHSITVMRYPGQPVA